MSNSKNQSPHQAKDTILLIGWIAVILIMAVCLWIFTQQSRNNSLIIAVNKVLEQSGDSRKLRELDALELPYSFGMSKWFSLDSGKQFSDEKKAFVFSLLGEGTFFPCLAVVADDGKVEEFIPLNVHGEKIIKRISPGILKIYSRRIGEIE